MWKLASNSLLRGFVALGRFDDFRALPSGTIGPQYNVVRLRQTFDDFDIGSVVDSYFHRHDMNAVIDDHAHLAARPITAQERG